MKTVLLLLMTVACATARPQFSTGSSITLGNAIGYVAAGNIGPYGLGGTTLQASSSAANGGASFNSVSSYGPSYPDVLSVGYNQYG